MFYDAVLDFDGMIDGGSSGRRAALETLVRIQVPLLGGGGGDGKDAISMKDRPSLVGRSLVYVSTHEDTGVPRTSWSSVYSTELTTGITRRLTPLGVADFSPSVSPSGAWTAVASYGEKGGNFFCDSINYCLSWSIS